MSEWFWIELLKQITSIFGYLAWPLAVLTTVLLLRDKIFNFLKNKEINLKGKGIELVVSALNKNVQLSPMQRKELSSLTAHDIWALDGFVKGQQPNEIDKLSLAAKVGVASFIEMGLLVKNGNKIDVTDLGRQLHESAEKIVL